MSVLDHHGKSAHQLRTELRKANIDIGVLKAKLAAREACLAGHHLLVRDSDTCIICAKVDEKVCANVEVEA